MDLTTYIRDVPDFPKPGILFKDITPLLSSPEAFRFAVQAMADQYQSTPFDAIAAAEARGFLFAAPLALALGKALVPLRKPGKLPYHSHTLRYDLEYGSAELQMHVDAVSKGDKILLVDDLLATGGTMRAGASLVEKAGGIVIGCAFLVELSFLAGRERLAPYPVFSLLKY